MNSLPIEVYISSLCHPVSPGGTIGIGLVIAQGDTIHNEYCEAQLASDDNNAILAQEIAFTRIIEFLPNIASAEAEIFVYSASNTLSCFEVLSELRQNFPYIQFVVVEDGANLSLELANAAVMRFEKI